MTSPMEPEHAAGAGASTIRLNRLDQAGCAASVACAIHCALSPLLVPALPLLAGRVVGPAMEVAFTCLSLLIGTASLHHSYRVVHRARTPLVLFIAGFTVLVVVRRLPLPGFVPEWAVTAVAASLIVSAHIVNLRSRRGVAAAACACPCHDD
jgi:hypothetical protein